MTLIYVWIPFATLPILAALGRIDVRLHDAAADLYASPFQQFRRVTLPLSLPGHRRRVPDGLHPDRRRVRDAAARGRHGRDMYGNIIQDFFIRAANWPLGSALSVIMLVVTLVLVVVGLRIVQPRRLLGVMTLTAARDVARPAPRPARAPRLLLAADRRCCTCRSCILFVFSLNANTSLSFPLEGLHARLVREALRQPPALLDRGQEQPDRRRREQHRRDRARDDGRRSS